MFSLACKHSSVKCLWQQESLLCRFFREGPDSDGALDEPERPGTPTAAPAVGADGGGFLNAVYLGLRDIAFLGCQHKSTVCPVLNTLP